MAALTSTPVPQPHAPVGIVSSMQFFNPPTTNSLIGDTYTVPAGRYARLRGVTEWGANTVECLLTLTRGATQYTIGPGYSQNPSTGFLTQDMELVLLAGDTIQWFCVTGGGIAQSWLGFSVEEFSL